MCAMCHESRKEDGRITVEMAVLLPMIVLWIVWLVYFMLFLLDMSVLKSEVIRVADEASFLRTEKGVLDTGEYDIPYPRFHSRISVTAGNNRASADTVSSRLKKRLKERLMLTECKDIKVYAGSRMISVQAALGFRWPFPGFKTIGVHGLQFTGRAAAPVSNWEQWLWIMAAATDIPSLK